MIKLNANLSKKVPMPDVDFSSQQYGAALEVEIGDTADEAALAEKLVKMYRLLERSIDQQIAGKTGAETTTPPTSTPPSRRTSSGNHQGNGHASPAQVKAIFAISRDRGVSRDRLIADIRERFGVDRPDYLSVRDASDLIGELQAMGRAGV